ncbi:hypothetical protein DFH08DRAFT_818390 [Mycena albidolilacea]|uniref:Uncharacterized protein n=1 Tax=Mycena albidolilacea TaxID=1033008 RepID=A0AAD6ZGP7_9AGAR|nr:hypothetical protein DFH08DRAFT_818390 [Mycena albidolilacea]
MNLRTILFVSIFSVVLWLATRDTPHSTDSNSGCSPAGRCPVNACGPIIKTNIETNIEMNFESLRVSVTRSRDPISPILRLRDPLEAARPNLSEATCMTPDSSSIDSPVHISFYGYMPAGSDGLCYDSSLGAMIGACCNILTPILSNYFDPRGHYRAMQSSTYSVQIRQTGQKGGRYVKTYVSAQINPYLLPESVATDPLKVHADVPLRSICSGLTKPQLKQLVLVHNIKLPSRGSIAVMVDAISDHGCSYLGNTGVGECGQQRRSKGRRRAATTKAAQERRGTAMRDAEDDGGHEDEGEREDEDKRDSNGNSRE